MGPDLTSRNTNISVQEYISLQPLSRSCRELDSTKGEDDPNVNRHVLQQCLLDHSLITNSLLSRFMRIHILFAALCGYAAADFNTLCLKDLCASDVVVRADALADCSSYMYKTVTPATA